MFSPILSLRLGPDSPTRRPSIQRAIPAGRCDSTQCRRCFIALLANRSGVAVQHDTENCVGHS
jgi:hypothetical protein